MFSYLCNAVLLPTVLHANDLIERKFTCDNYYTVDVPVSIEPFGTDGINIMLTFAGR